MLSLFALIASVNDRSTNTHAVCRQTGHRNLLKKTKIEIVNNTNQCSATLGDIDIHANHLYFVTKDIEINLQN